MHISSHAHYILSTDLAYEKGYDELDELCQMSEAPVQRSFHVFVEENFNVFGTEYMRAPNETDLRRIISINEGRGFPDCVGSWDCQNWTWENCPVAWAGQFKGKEKKPTVVLEKI